MTLAVRRLFETDEPALCFAVHRSLPELGRWMPWATRNFDEVSAGAFIENADSAERMDLAITWDDELVGVCGVNQINIVNRTGNLGYWVRSDKTGSGLGWQAAAMTAKRAADERSIHRFQITMSVHNDASRATAEKLGAGFEGIARDSLVLNGEFHDARIYSYFVDEENVPERSADEMNADDDYL